MSKAKRSAVVAGMFLIAMGGLVAPSRGQNRFLEVHPGVDPDEPTFDIRRQIAERLTAAHVPPSQPSLTLFSGVEFNAYPAIRGWWASIKDIQYLRGAGVVATIRVGPELEGGPYDSHKCLERYLVTAEGVRFIDATIPRPGTPRILIQP